MRQCEVFLHGIKAGVLTENDDKEFTFVYDKAYMLSDKCQAVSLTLPLRQDPYQSPYLFSAFANTNIHSFHQNCKGNIWCHLIIDAKY